MASVIKLDMIQSVAVAAVLLFVGYGVRKRIGFLDRFNIPAPVVGGFLFAAVALALRQFSIVAFEFDTTLQTPLMVAFFTSIGLGASLALLRRGGYQVILFWGLASGLAVIQSGVGIALASALGLDPLLGLLAGSTTMTGGHGTGAAFGKLFEEQYQLAGALPLAIAAATFGLVGGGILGGPVGTRLLQKHKLHGPAPLAADRDMMLAAQSAAVDSPIEREPAGDAPTAFSLLRMLTVILVCMAVGGILSGALGKFVTLPAYIGAMIVAAVFRNVGDSTAVIRIDMRTVEDIGTIALSLFLTMALMSLRLWELFDLAIPLLVILFVQVVIMALFAYFITFRVMGRDYEAAVMSAGHCGFGLGATPNAVANMESLVERFGAAPRAYLVLPMVGAFFIDFSNAMIITTYINFVR